MNVARLLRLQMYREALASVALSHPESCACLACRASKGDQRAFAEALELIESDRKHD